MQLIILLWKKNVNLLMKVTQSYQSKDSKKIKIGFGIVWQEVIDVKLIHIKGPNFYL